LCYLFLRIGEANVLHRSSAMKKSWTDWLAGFKVITDPCRRKR